MKRPKGMLVRKNPYRVSPNGPEGMKVVINHVSGWEIGDKVYEERMENGIIILIPENVYLGEKND